MNEYLVAMYIFSCFIETIVMLACIPSCIVRTPCVICVISKTTPDRVFAKHANLIVMETGLQNLLLYRIYSILLIKSYCSKWYMLADSVTCIQAKINGALMFPVFSNRYNVLFE